MTTQPPPPNAKIDDLSEGQLYALDFHTYVLATIGRTIYYADHTGLLNAGLARIGHPELSANPATHHRTFYDGSIVYTAVPTPATGPSQERHDKPAEIPTA